MPDIKRSIRAGAHKGKGVRMNPTVVRNLLIAALTHMPKELENEYHISHSVGGRLRKAVAELRLLDDMLTYP